METFTFEVALSVQEVAAALPALHQEFLRRQQFASRGAPFVQCSELTARLTLSGIPTPPAWPKPVADSIEQFRFHAEWKQPQRLIVQVWTLQIEAHGRGVRLTLYPMVEAPADCRDLYRLFAALVEAWTAQVEQEQGDEAPPKRQGWPKPEPLHCNQWLAVQYFDHGKTKLKELVDEWVRIRKEKDIDAKQDLANPIASMQTFIYEEKKRRRT